MPMNIERVATVFAIFSGVLPACLVPPPCTPPTTLQGLESTPADQCAPSPEQGNDFQNWPDIAKNAQLYQELAVYGAKLTFAALDASTQTKKLDSFRNMLAKENDADQAYIKTVNAVLAANGQDFVGAIADLDAAVRDMVDFLSDSSVAGGSTAASGNLSDVRGSATKLSTLAAKSSE